MRILSVSDKVEDLIHSPMLPERFGDVDLVLACGDLDYDYLEFIVTLLGKPLYYVLGNHAQKVVLCEDGSCRTEPGGCINIHRRIVNHNGVLIAGLEGSLRYRDGDHQYTQAQMYGLIATMAPRLAWNRWRHGRAVDILITHAPPWGIHDAPDLCHQGFRAYLRFMDKYKPRYLIHGHQHLYRQDALRVTQHGATTVINTFGHQVIDLDESSLTPDR